MPTILRNGPFRFYYQDHQTSEDSHVFVERDQAVAKAWFEPVRIARSHGFLPLELRTVLANIEQFRARLMEACVTGEERGFEVAIRNVSCDADSLIVDLMDGRTISVPLSWFPKLAAASPQQRDDWRITGDGLGIHWPELDEDLGVAGFLKGAPPPLD